MSSTEPPIEFNGLPTLLQKYFERYEAGYTFYPADLKRRISVKVGSSMLRGRLPMAVRNEPADAGAQINRRVRTRDAAFDADLRRPLQDVKLSYRPEDLETMNEGLQSTNEELQTQSIELNQVNAFLELILMSLRGGGVALAGEVQVLVWNSQAEDLRGLRGDDVVGKHFLNLDIGLPVEQLGRPLRACLLEAAVQTTTTLDATRSAGHAGHL